MWIFRPRDRGAAVAKADSVPQARRIERDGSTAQKRQRLRPHVDGPVVTVGPEGHFGTVSDAIAYLQNHTSDSGTSTIREIRIASGVTLSESISIDDSGLGSFPPGVRIFGEGPVPPVLSPSGNGPAVELNSVTELTLENLTIDCAARQAGILLSGYMMNTKLKDIELRGIQQFGILAKGASGLARRPLAVSSCRFLLDGSGTAAQWNSTALNDTRQIVVERCHFVGAGRAGLEFSGNTWDLKVSGSIFHQMNTGVLFSGQMQDLNGLAFENNTFSETDRGIVFEHGPIAAAERFTFARNLFVKLSGAEVWTESDVTLQALSGRAPPTQYNWTDRATATGPNALEIFGQGGRRGSAVLFESTDPDDRNFLKPEGDALRIDGKQGVNPRNYIGAVAP